MPKSDQIKRLRPDPDALDFETLKKEAIARVQDLSGEIWTDYNLHDPGVTILEQLCYGLTDLAYRSGFEAKDYLAGKNGIIDFERQALFRPEEILPSSPVTCNDYQKILYDAIPGIDNIWFKPASSDGNAPRGLFSVFVKLSDNLSETNENVPRQNDRLDEISIALERLRKSSNRVSETLDQLGDSLDTRRDALRRWHGRKKKNALAPGLDHIISQAEKILSLLDTSLVHLDKIWKKLDFVWNMLVDSTDDSISVPIARLEETLSQLDDVLSNPTFFSLLNDIFPALDAPLSRLNDLFFTLNDLLPELDISLCALEKSLAEISTGLFTPSGITDQNYGAQNEDVIKRRIISVFAEHRNLCEDIDTVQIVKTVPYFLVGEIEIQPLHDPVKIYAEVFFRCAQYISSGIRVDRYEAIFAQEKNYEQIFSGPLTQHGYINDKFLEVSRESLRVVDLIALISQIDGVKQVRNLSLMDQENQKHTSISCDPSQGFFPSLCFPEFGKARQILRLVFPQNVSPKNEIKNISYTQARDYKDDLLLEKTRLELGKLIFEFYAFRNNLQPFKQLIKLPKGQWRELQAYSSIQNQFPAIYGINRYGVPKSASLAIQAKAKQLKAYLFPCEQLIANYLKGLQEIPQLFSLDTELKSSYFTQFIDNKMLPDIEQLYAKDSNYAQQLIPEIQSYYDKFGERRNRILDTQLAIYGEEFPQRSLLRFNFYRRTDACNWLIENKIKFLKYIREISRDRARGINYLEPSLKESQAGEESNIASIQNKISILLGLAKFNNTQLLTDVLIKKDSYLVPDKKYEKKIKFLEADEKGEAVPELLEADIKFKNIMPSTLPLFSYSIFREGIFLENYRLVQVDEETVICFKPRQDDRLWPLASRQDHKSAVLYAHQYCHAITHLNMESEGLHIIEHILLRPYGDDATRETPDDRIFYSFRVSVIFPSWTARFSDKEFRKYAEETVQKNLPAHVYAEFYWLDFVYMVDFEQRYSKWLDLMRQAKQAENNDSAVLVKLDHASEKIISFLLRNKQKNETEYWV